MRTRLLLLFGIGLCTVGSLPVLATGEVESAAASAGALQAGTAVDGEPFVDFIFATPAEYTRRTGNSITQYGESPMLTELVQQGELPPVGERLPDEPLVLRPIDEIGHYGGTIRALTPSGPGYDEDRRLLIWPPDGSEFHPNMIKGWQQAADDRSITLYLRSGMKWSDGEDFGADDFQFWWQDIQNNEMITPEVPSAFRPGGEPATLTVVNPFEVRFDFAVPVPNAIEFWHQSRPWAPRHYLEQYHIDYNADVEANAKADGFDSWVLAFSVSRRVVHPARLQVQRAAGAGGRSVRAGADRHRGVRVDPQPVLPRDRHGRKSASVHRQDPPAGGRVGGPHSTQGNERRSGLPADPAELRRLPDLQAERSQRRLPDLPVREQRQLVRARVRPQLHPPGSDPAGDLQ